MFLFSLRVFSWFLFVSAGIQFLALYFWFHHWNNMPLLHIYVAGGGVLLLWFYRTVLGDFVNSAVLWSGAALFFLFSVINSVFVQPVLTFNSNALTVESVLILILALFTFGFLLNDNVKTRDGHDRQSIGWINWGLFIYYSSSLLIFYFGSTITRQFSFDLNQYTWIFHSFFSMVMYTCFIVGIWKRSAM
jgi:hypothetical protein